MRRQIMGKVIHCNKVNPSSDCQHSLHGKTVEEVLEKAKVHAKEHGLEPTPRAIGKSKIPYRRRLKLISGALSSGSH